MKGNAPQPEQDSSFWCCRGCAGGKEGEEDILGEQAVVADNPIAVSDLFPIIYQDIRISLDTGREGSLSASFLKSEHSVSHVSFTSQLIRMQSIPEDKNQNPFSETKYVKPTEVEELTAEAKQQANPIKEAPIEPKPELRLPLLLPHENSMIKRGKFSSDEDEALKELVKQYGEGNWSIIAERMPGRNRKQVRERYVNVLKKPKSTNEYTPEEDTLIMNLVGQYGKKWTFISTNLEGKTPQMIKNRYYSQLRSSAKLLKKKLNGTSNDISSGTYSNEDTHKDSSLSLSRSGIGGASGNETQVSKTRSLQIGDSLTGLYAKKVTELKTEGSVKLDPETEFLEQQEEKLATGLKTIAERIKSLKESLANTIRIKLN